jgi:hypothetical protein
LATTSGTAGRRPHAPYYTIDGNRLPGGDYLFKVEASDAPGNPSGWRLPTTATDAIEITILSGGESRRAVDHRSNRGSDFDVTDATSRIVKASTVDGGTWQLIFLEMGSPTLLTRYSR